MLSLKRSMMLALSVVSSVIGIALLVVTSMAIDKLIIEKPILNTCKDVSETYYICTNVSLAEYLIVACVFGIVASIIQIASVGLIWLKETKIWCGVHLLICVLAVTSFSIVLNESGLKEDAIDKIKAFAIIFGLDTVFSFVAAIAILYKLEFS